MQPVAAWRRLAARGLPCIAIRLLRGGPPVYNLDAGRAFGSPDRRGH
jgi:hypothetical protein